MRKIVKTFIVTKCATQRSIKKQTRVVFMQFQPLITIKDARDQFHNNFKVKLPRMQVTRHVSVRLETFFIE